MCLVSNQIILYSVFLSLIDVFSVGTSRVSNLCLFLRLPFQRMFALTQRSFSKLSRHSIPNLGSLRWWTMDPHTAFTLAPSLSVMPSRFPVCVLKWFSCWAYQNSLPMWWSSTRPLLLTPLLSENHNIKKGSGVRTHACCSSTWRQRQEDLQVEG